MLHSHIGAGNFKTKCLKLLDIVAETRRPLIITKHGKAVAKLVPIPPDTDLFGALAGSVLHESDIISPLENQWAVTC
jgi:prevent-host-death family protein